MAKPRTWPWNTNFHAIRVYTWIFSFFSVQSWWGLVFSCCWCIFSNGKSNISWLYGGVTWICSFACSCFSRYEPKFTGIQSDVTGVLANFSSLQSNVTSVQSNQSSLQSYFSSI